MSRRDVCIVVAISCLVPFSGFPAESPSKHAGSRPGLQIDHCAPVSARLAAGATLAGRIGTYGLALVEVRNGVHARRAQGVLTLLRQPPGLDRLKTASTPLYGFTDVDLRAVGAYRVGDPASKNPNAPGALVLESLHDGKRRILLRLGADANRRDEMLFDGAFTVLEVHKISGDGFTGNWRSGARLSRTGGYFCARRVHEKAGARVAPRLE